MAKDKGKIRTHAKAPPNKPFPFKLLIAPIVVVLVAFILSQPQHQHQQTPKEATSSQLPITIPTQPPPIAVLESRMGFFNEVVSIVRATRRGHPMKVLAYGKSILGGIWEVEDTPSIFSVFNLMHLPVYDDVPSVKKHALIIGLGIGTSVRSFNSHGIVCDVVEIDPVVVEFARKHFGFTIKGEVYTEDALLYLGGKDWSDKAAYYDIIVHDVFSGNLNPHLFTFETLTKIDYLLRRDGVLVLNYIGRRDSAATLALLRTLRAVWGNVRCFVDMLKNDEAYPIGNLLFFASHKEMKFNTPRPDPSYPKYSQLWMVSHSPNLEIFFDTTNEGPIVTEKDHSMILLDDEFKEYFKKCMLDLFSEQEWEEMLRLT